MTSATPLHTAPQARPFVSERRRLTTDEFLGYFARVRKVGLNKWKALCPAHDDHDPSLGLTLVPDKWLVKCWSRGCNVRTIVAGARLEMADLFLRDRPFDGKRWAAPMSASSPLERAHSEVLDEARRQPWSRHLDLYAASDSIRAAHRLAAEARALATGLGDTDRGWELAVIANALERDALQAEEEIDRT
jgi:hypothetical protein